MKVAFPVKHQSATPRLAAVALPVRSGADQPQPGSLSGVIGLRYPGHGTLGCASQPQALPSGVKQAYGVEAGAPDPTSPDNIGEAHFTDDTLASPRGVEIMRNKATGGNGGRE